MGCSSPLSWPASWGSGPAAAPQAEPPPGAQISASLEYVARVPGTAQVVEGKFDKVRGRDVLIITGRFGFKTLDVSDPTNPRVLDTFQPAEILGPNGYWQDEDMDIDVRRNLIIGALDPRHDNVDQASCPGHRHARLEEAEPGLPLRLLRHLVRRSGEPRARSATSSTCPRATRSAASTSCNYVWAGGPARRDDQPTSGRSRPAAAATAGRSGSPTSGTRRSPNVFPEPIDLWRNDGLTDYSHDVDVDDHGIAWTSGRGGLLGYATKGRWRDPRTDKVRKARPWDPILVAGGGIEGGPDGVAQPQTDFIHNAARPLDGKVRATGVPDGNVVLMTEEDFTGPCSASGRIVAADITDSLGGEPATNSTPAQPYRLNALSAFHPTQDAGDTTSPSGSCSAHYFEVSGSTVAAAWYGQGLRLIDASDARNLRQVGYYYVTGTDPATNPSSLVLGRRLARRPDLPVRHEPWGRDTAPRGRPREVLDPADGAGARGAGGPARGAAGLRPDARVARLPGVRDARPGLTASGAGWAARTPPHPGDSLADDVKDPRRRAASRLRDACSRSRLRRSVTSTRAVLIRRTAAVVRSEPSCYTEVLRWALPEGERSRRRGLAKPAPCLRLSSDYAVVAAR